MFNTRHARLRSPRRLSTIGLIGVAACALGACSRGPTGADDTIEREVFIETYADLRVAALGTEERVISDSARTEVLARHGVTAEDLLHFAEVHGRDVEYMRDVWNDLEVRLDGLTVEPVEDEPDSVR